MQFVRELFGKTKEELRFFVVIDNDGTEDEKLLDIYAKSIQNSLNLRGLNRYSCKYHKKLSCFEIYSELDNRLKCYVKVFHIPQSLESELVKKCIVKCRYSPNIQSKLAQMSPHNALKRITEDKGLPLEDLIRKSVNEGWFSDELWFKKIIRDISLMFSLKD